MAADVDRVLERCRTLFGGFDALTWPGGYRDSMALCIVDSIQSTGVRYPSVEKVVQRYRDYRRASGGDPATDGADQLAASFAELGGSEGWASVIGNGHRTSTHRGAPLKAEAVSRAADAVLASNVRSAQDFRDAIDDTVRRTELAAAWLGVVGQRSGITWRYVQMLAGVPGVKPDRMITRFVADALGVPRASLGSGRVADLVTEVAQRAGIRPTILDHAIWGWQRRRR